MTVLHPLSRSVLALALIAAFATSAPTTQAQSAADSDLPRGHFYTQAGGDTPRPDDGFLVADRPGFGFTSGRNFVRFWSEFERYGGVAILGYPASRPFVFDGFDVQAFQKGILQWRPDAGPDGRAWAMNVLDEFTRRGLDGRLLAENRSRCLAATRTTASRSIRSRAWEIGPGEWANGELDFPRHSATDPAGLRLLHRTGQVGSPGSAVVVDLPEPIPTASAQPPAVQRAVAAAAAETGLNARDVQIISAEQTEWSNSSLGCPRPGLAYAQVITPGWRVLLRAGGLVLQYHTDSGTNVVLCGRGS